MYTSWSILIDSSLMGLSPPRFRYPISYDDWRVWKRKKKKFLQQLTTPIQCFFFFFCCPVSVCLLSVSPIELNKISLTKEKKTENLRKISNDNQIIQKPNLNSNKNNRCLQRIRIYDHVWNHRIIIYYSRRNPRNTDNSWWFASKSFRQGDSFFFKRHLMIRLIFLFFFSSAYYPIVILYMY